MTDSRGALELPYDGFRWLLACSRSARSNAQKGREEARKLGEWTHPRPRLHLLLARCARDVDHCLERMLRLARTIEQQRIVRSIRNRIAVLPVHSVVYAPERHSIDRLALAIENAEELGIALRELPIDVGRQSVLVRIEEALELRQLKLRMHHALPDDLPFLRERQHVDIELRDHHLQAEGRVRSERRFDVLAARII